MRRKWPWLLAGVTLAGAAGLWGGAGTAHPNDAAGADYAVQREYAVDGYTIVVASNEGTARVLQEKMFTVSVKGADGMPVTGAQLLLAIDMPDMFCGTSRAELGETEPGRYTGSGIPLMAGRQKAEVTVKGAGGAVLKVDYPFLAER
ncbi:MULTISPECIES: FixH family protein [Paenibacillus]|uniref:FixH family protein n=1 Tax=Paenibacillus TaxID=44249 RepID=UPI0022B896B6|nr:FixH family protein [Paenibacillus caseinilyticus]MCZ8519964.1 FixH family protein [Paenibacillus caseinilyticus]